MDERIVKNFVGALHKLRNRKIWGEAKRQHKMTEGRGSRMAKDER